MTRKILIVVGVALLSALGFMLVLGIGYLTLLLVLGDSPYTLDARIHGMSGVLLALFALVAFIAAGWTASVLSRQRKNGNEAHLVRR